MKRLKRLLLIHWHHYEKEIIDFENINFLTGKTATGKSTIIDALQLVLLGDTTGTFFNKAANDKSARTLKSYLYCEEGDDGGAGFRYLRQGQFTSYVVVEFEDTERNTKFSCGLICDCFSDGTYKSRWFILNNSGIPENCFIDTKSNTPFDSTSLNTYLRNNLGKKGSAFDFFDTNKRYQEIILGKFGQMKQKYHTLLRKAVPFTPITDIEQFITESICDVRNNIDVEKMQSDIRHYKNLEEDAERIRERITILQAIDGFNKAYDREKELYLTQSYVIDKANLEEQKREQATLEANLEKKELELAECEQNIGEVSAKLQKVSETRGEKEAEYRSSDILAKQKRLEKDIAEIEEKIDVIIDNVTAAVINLQNYGKQWAVALQNPALQFLEGAKSTLTYMQNMERLNIKTIAKLDFEEAAKVFENVKEQVQVYAKELQKRLEQIKANIVELEQRIANLRKGIKPYPERMQALKRLLEQEIFKTYNKAVIISPLADLLELKDLKWQNAVEGYLATQKFYLLVPRDYYVFALKVYNAAKKEMGLYDIGLIDIAALNKYYHGEINRNSLAEEIESENKDALLYANFLLGKVIKCSSVEELNRHKVSITANCMLYKNFVSRRINPKLYENPFIGRKAMERQLELCTKELKEQKQEEENQNKAYQIVSKTSKLPSLVTYEANSYAQNVEATKLIPKLEQQQKQLEQELSSLDLMYLEKLREQIDLLTIQSFELNSSKEQLIEIRGSMREKIRNLKDTLLPQTLNGIVAIEQSIASSYDEAWIIKVGEPKYRDALKETRVTQSLRSSFERALKATASRRDSYLANRTEQRSKYNTIYHMPFDVSKENNSDFDNELTSLNEVKLPEYLDKIKDAKEKAYVQFKDDFIAKIKSNIETVKQQIEELNASLRQSVFGTDKYHFVIKPRAEYQQYYDMITDPMLMDTGGWNLTSENFNSKYQKEISELFNMLILNETNVSAEKRAEYEKAIRKYTDYKTYLVFDLIVTNEQGFEQRLSKTLLKKSGGETQIPFYIALLASFSQVCRIRNKTQNNTIRLIILDEAFSKMDGERIKESIPLLRRFGLQAIFSAPPDKIPDIAPLVDRNIAVYKVGDYSFTRSFDPKELEDFKELA